ncbi:hypothetical protein [Botryobacter ruber]|uniref:hypothetical protein n=1 Tax=Botryobacter ruber TaxID=2171629 RepID=UPI000E0AE147|nr:hypothetical protein [Botryobacter ruber]
MHEPAHHNTDVRPLTEKVSHHISSFIHDFTRLLYIGMGLLVAGLVMKYFAVTGGGFVFIFAASLLSLLFMLQIVLSFFYVIANLWLALMGAFCSLSLVMGFLALMFRYQSWVGWKLMFFISLPLFLITLVFLGIYLPKRGRLPIPHRHFLFRNLLGPYLFMLFLGIASMAVNISQFNMRADAKRENMPQEATPDTDAATDTSGLWRSY